MHAALRLAQEQFGPQLVSAYALGSLVHGGFAPKVSDVDLALILQDVTPETEEQMQEVKRRVVAEQRSPLAARLSLFWTTWAALKSGARLGRFPLADRLDLLDDGQPLHGPNWRSEIPRPGRAELV